MAELAFTFPTREHVHTSHFISRLSSCTASSWCVLQTAQLVAFLQQLLTHEGYYDENLEFIHVERVQVRQGFKCDGLHDELVCPKSQADDSIVLLITLPPTPFPTPLSHTLSHTPSHTHTYRTWGRSTI